MRRTRTSTDSPTLPSGLFGSFEFRSGGTFSSRSSWRSRAPAPLATATLRRSQHRLGARDRTRQRTRATESLCPSVYQLRAAGSAPGASARTFDLGDDARLASPASDGSDDVGGPPAARPEAQLRLGGRAYVVEPSQANNFLRNCRPSMDGRPSSKSDVLEAHVSPGADAACADSIAAEENADRS